MEMILEMMNGRRFEATLAKSFRPEDNEVDVLIEHTRGIEKFPFPEICCVLMKSHQNWMFLFHNDTLQE